ncbi:uncharacterized protein LOC143610423 [Bidens hawaiensis]|uniref:uncharacterized protein LOC143610423 n=1 Tax=Bidens hawaiensis TaxID=980011 RepID=UPI00404B4A04
MSKAVSRGTSKLTSRLTDNSEITHLSRLDASMTNVKIKVRIIKLWKLPSYKVVNGTHAVEVILMDEEGSKIQATVNGTYLIKHEKFLVEKSCVFIQRFDIGDNMSTYRVTNPPHRLFLTFDSTVTKCNVEVGSLYGLTLADFDVLRNNGVPPDLVIDLIGSHNIFVTLWESYAEQLNTFMANKREDDTVVIILQFGKYTFSGGRAYVSSCFQGSNLFINDSIEEIISFKNSLLGNEGHQSVSTRRLVSSQLPCSLENDFLTHSVFSTIADVNKKEEVKSVVVTGTIISFMPGVD